MGKSILGENSSITYKNNGGYKIPLTNSSADAEAVQRAWDFNEGWFSEPVYLTGDYPATVKDYVSGFLRDFTDEEKQEILGSADFYAHDAYSAQFYMAPESGLEACIGNETHPLYPTCADSTYTYFAEDGGWVVGPAADPGSPWLHKATDWVPAFLKYMQDTWVTPSPGPAKGVAVTEFGFSEPFESSKTLLQDILYDTIRASYYHDYMEAILMAIAEGTDVIGSLAWSFVDNYVRPSDDRLCVHIAREMLTNVIHRSGNKVTSPGSECNMSILQTHLYAITLPLLRIFTNNRIAASLLQSLVLRVHQCIQSLRWL